MNLSTAWPRIKGRYQRTVSSIFFARQVNMRNRIPYISFTFDDFPSSALYKGGEILLQFGLRATYYASFGLIGKEAPTGMIFMPDDIEVLLKNGHELGCHTYAHCDSWETNPMVFENSININKQALDKLIPGLSFRSFSYPITVPRPSTKRIAGNHFYCCRGGGQAYNINRSDLNLLKAFFLEKNRNDPRYIKDVIDHNYRDKGWLIFATHDISERPTPYGCTPAFFEGIVKYSLDSGARILPVAEALDSILDNMNH